MASIYKRTRDKKRKGSSWYIGYVDHEGRPRTKKGCPDKAATEAMARKLESDVALRKIGLIDLKAEAYRNHEARPLSEHLVEFQAVLVAKGNTEKHVDLYQGRAKRLVEVAGATRISDLVTSRIQTAVMTLREEKLSLETCNHYIRAIKGFSRWLWKDGRARDYSLAPLETFNAQTDRKHPRRAFTEDELSRILAAAQSGPDILEMTGPERAMLYHLTVGTGFRANEIRTLTPESFNLDDNPPTVTVRAAYSKRRRDDVQPIRSDLAELLRSWLDGKKAGQPVFALPEKCAAMLRLDLETALVPYKDALGRFGDFHALRHTYITRLAQSGAAPKTAQTLARHSTITLTMDRYTHAKTSDQTEALNALPAIGSARPVNQVPEVPLSGIEGQDSPARELLDFVAFGPCGEDLSFSEANSGGGTRTPDTRIMIPLL